MSEGNLSKEKELDDECWSVDEADFSYQSLGDLLDCHDELEPGSIVYRAKPAHAEPGSFVDSGDIIELMADRAYDEHGEYAENWPEPTPEAKRELDDFLMQWAEKYCPTRFYAVKEIEPYTITAEDLA